MFPGKLLDDLIEHVNDVTCTQSAFPAIPAKISRSQLAADSSSKCDAVRGGRDQLAPSLHEQVDIPSVLVQGSVESEVTSGQPTTGEQAAVIVQTSSKRGRKRKITEAKPSAESASIRYPPLCPKVWVEKHFSNFSRVAPRIRDVPGVAPPEYDIFGDDMVNFSVGGNIPDCLILRISVGDSKFIVHNQRSNSVELVDRQACRGMKKWMLVAAGENIFEIRCHSGFLSVNSTGVLQIAQRVSLAAQWAVKWLLHPALNIPILEVVSLTKWSLNTATLSLGALQVQSVDSLFQIHPSHSAILFYGTSQDRVVVSFEPFHAV